MGNRIVVDPSQLNSVAGTVSNLAGDFNSKLSQLKNDVQAMAASGWQGSDSQEYLRAIETFYPQMQALQQVMQQYSDFLKQASAAYAQAQDSTAQAAAKLRIG